MWKSPFYLSFSFCPLARAREKHTSVLRRSVVLLGSSAFVQSRKQRLSLSGRADADEETCRLGLLETVEHDSLAALDHRLEIGSDGKVLARKKIAEDD